MINKLPSLEDVRVFVTVAHCKSFSQAALQLHASRAYISKRIKLLEQNLNTVLFFRTARAIHLTEEGHIILRSAEHVLAQWQTMQTELSAFHNTTQGSLRISCSTGFGSHYLTPFILKLRAQYPDLYLDLMLTDQQVDLIREGIDVDICIGGDLPEQYVARKLATNHRILCAAPSYLQQYGIPQSPEELEQHQCIHLRERNATTHNWPIQTQSRHFLFTPKSYLSVNNGDIAKQWCLNGEGVLLRSLWSIQNELTQKKLIHILPEWYQQADIFAVYPQRLHASANLTTFLTTLQHYLAKHFLDNY